MSYEELLEQGFTIEDAEFIEEYPRLYPLVSTLGIRKGQIDELFEKMMDSTWLALNTDHNSRQLHLRMMLARLNYYNSPLELMRYKGISDSNIERIFGKYCMKFAKELLKVI